MIGEKNTTISRLRALLAKPSTEKTSKVLEQAGIKAPPKNSPPANAPEPAEAGTRSKRRPGVWRGSPDQDRARFSEAGRRLSGVPEGQGLRTEGTRSAHPGGGPGADCGHGL